MQIDQNTAKALLCKINDKLKQIISKNDDSSDYYWCGSSSLSKNLDLHYEEKDYFFCTGFTLYSNKITFVVSGKIYDYFLNAKSRNWLEKIFFRNNVHDDVVYQEANILIDFAFRKLEEKRKNKDLKILNQFLKNS